MQLFLYISLWEEDQQRAFLHKVTIGTEGRGAVEKTDYGKEIVRPMIAARFKI